MFYNALKKSPLPYDPLKAIVSPRPIAWVGSKSIEGHVNLAPFSFFNIIADKPGIVIFSSDTEKDTILNIKETNEFTINLVTFDLKDQMLLSSERIPRYQSEFEHAGLEIEPSVYIGAPRVKGVAAALECKVLKVFEIEDLDGVGTDRHAVMGQVVGVYIDDEFIEDGRLATARMRIVSRLGYHDYAVADELFEMKAPDHPGLRK